MQPGHAGGNKPPRHPSWTRRNPPRATPEKEGAEEGKACKDQRDPGEEPDTNPTSEDKEGRCNLTLEITADQKPYTDTDTNTSACNNITSTQRTGATVPPRTRSTTIILCECNDHNLNFRAGNYPMKLLFRNLMSIPFRNQSARLH
jgi:hypothetical protein